MKKMFTLAFLACTFLFSSISFAALPSTIRFATEASYPPFEYMAPNGEIKGFDIDIAKALCAEMKVECTFTNQPFDSLIPSLKLGKFDALIGAINITDARKQQVDFTIPYYAATGSFLGLTNAKFPITAEGLKNKTIGVQGGSSFEHYLNDKYNGIVKIKTYGSIQDAFLDLTSGRVDAVLGDTPTILNWLNQNNNNQKYALFGEPINDPQSFGAGYGIAVKKGNDELLAAFNKAIMAIRANGSYEKIAHSNFDQHP